MGREQRAKEHMNAMTYDFEFQDTPQGQLRFLTLLRAFLAWAQQFGSKRTKEMRPREIAIMAEFRRLGLPVGLTPGEGEPDNRFRKLVKGGGTMHLDGNEITMLCERIDEVTMPVDEGEAIEDLVNWLKGVKNAVKQDEAPEQAEPRTPGKRRG
jgi:hypothetical protein